MIKLMGLCCSIDNLIKKGFTLIKQNEVRGEVQSFMRRILGSSQTL